MVINSTNTNKMNDHLSPLTSHLSPLTSNHLAQKYHDICPWKYRPSWLWTVTSMWRGQTSKKKIPIPPLDNWISNGNTVISKP